MQKRIVILLLIVFTIINLSALLVPPLFGCTCYRNGEKFCEGDCCGGATQCDCYDIGTDNCSKQV